jgi:hypothetical protein
MLFFLLAAQAAASAAAVSITFGPPVTVGGTGYIDAEQFPSGALAAANAGRVLARGAAASAAWHSENVSGMGMASACAKDTASCPGVCDVRTKHSKEEKCPTAPEYYRWGGKFSPDLATDGEELVDFGRLLPDDEKNQSWSAPNRSRYSYSASSDKLHATTEVTTVRFTGLPRSARLPPEVSSMIRLPGAAWLDLGGGKQLQTAMFCFNATGQACADSQSIAAFVSSDGGRTYGYSSMVADAKDLPFSQEGPNEHDCQLLPSPTGTRIGCAIRVDGGDGPINHHYLPYYWTHSSDLGASWSAPVAMNGTGSARPRLLVLGDTLLMSGACVRACACLPPPLLLPLLLPLLPLLPPPPPLLLLLLLLLISLLRPVCAFGRGADAQRGQAGRATLERPRGCRLGLLHRGRRLTALDTA